MSHNSTRVRRAAALLLFAGAACTGDRATAPAARPRLDAARTQADLRALDDALHQAALGSFSAMGERLTVGGAAGAAVAASTEMLAAGVDPSAAARRRVAAAAAQRL